MIGATILLITLLILVVITISILIYVTVINFIDGEYLVGVLYIAITVFVIGILTGWLLIILGI
ncbi:MULTISPECIES: hypothetical protein [Staphylococcus]|uniref:hypothetical protein n=1 Tax=Staphylococcus TaxID=1279 RepID=UPI0011C74D9D|nr:hypothetical protein [Staphylococcus nepalensis]